MAEEEDVELAPSKSGINKKTIIIIALIVVLVIAGSIGATVFFLSSNSQKNNSSSDEHSDEVDAEHVDVVSKPAIYFELKPDFIINFESDGKANFLSIQLQVMVRETETISAIEEHMPVIRNNVLLLLSSQKYDVIRTLDGKNKLREDISVIIKKIIDEKNIALKEELGEEFHKVAYIEKVYFTGFIMQ